MRIRSAVLSFLIAGAAHVYAAAPQVLAIVNAASYKTQVAPGTLVSLFGVNLAASEASGNGAMPTTLGGTTVTANGTKLPLLYVSAGQVNALIPLGTEGRPVTPEGGAEQHVLDVVVKNASGTGETFTVVLSDSAPALFSLDASGTGAVVATKGPDGPLAESIVPGDEITVFATGLGAVDDGGNCTTLPKLRFGDAVVGVKSAKMSSVAGVYLVTATVPRQLSTDEIVLVGASGAPEASAKQTTGLPLAPSANVTNVDGGLDVVYGSNVQVNWSPVALVGKFHVSFDVPATAKPFTVAVKFRHIGATAVSIAIDPAAGTATMTRIVPTMPEHNGDFSASAHTPVDLLTGQAFPGRMVPMSRMYIAAVRALDLLPMPNAAGGICTNGLTVEAGKKFEIAADAGAFSVFLDIPAGVASGTTLEDEAVLYVDGREVASVAFSAEAVTE